MPRRLEFASFLRAQRRDRAVPLTQRDLADALGYSVPLISSWEKDSDPALPREHVLPRLATVLATDRPRTSEKLSVLTDDELTADERQQREKVLAELRELWSRSRPATGRQDQSARDSLWDFPDGKPVQIICAPLTSSPLGEEFAHNRIALHNYADLDAMVELFGHLRARNPDSPVRFRRQDRLRDDDLQGHVVLLGNLAWLPEVGGAFLPPEIPVRPVEDPAVEDGEVFEVVATGDRFYPEFDSKGHVTSDVALFLRTRNPANPDLTVTICSGVFTRGGYAAVRSLTDATVREENHRFLTEHAGDAETFGVLVRVATPGSLVRTPLLRQNLFAFS